MIHPSLWSLWLAASSSVYRSRFSEARPPVTMKLAVGFVLSFFVLNVHLADGAALQSVRDASTKSEVTEPPTTTIAAEKNDVKEGTVNEDGTLVSEGSAGDENPRDGEDPPRTEEPPTGKNSAGEDGSLADDGSIIEGELPSGEESPKEETSEGKDSSLGEEELPSGEEPPKEEESHGEDDLLGEEAPPSSEEPPDSEDFPFGEDPPGSEDSPGNNTPPNNESPPGNFSTNPPSSTNTTGPPAFLAPSVPPRGCGHSMGRVQCPVQWAYQQACCQTCKWWNAHTPWDLKNKDHGSLYDGSYCGPSLGTMYCPSYAYWTRCKMTCETWNFGGYLPC